MLEAALLSLEEQVSAINPLLLTTCKLLPVPHRVKAPCLWHEPDGRGIIPMCHASSASPKPLSDLPPQQAGRVPKIPHLVDHASLLQDGCSRKLRPQCGARAAGHDPQGQIAQANASFPFQKAQLLRTEVVVAYLGSKEISQKEQVEEAASNDSDDFS